MSTRDHTHYRDDIGAYLLGALTDLERQAFESHIANCAECRDEIEQLRPAANALPRSVEQVEPPPGLKTALMEIVEREAREAAPETAAPPRRRSLRERLRMPALRPVLVAGALLLGLVAGFAVSQQLGGDDERTVVATVDQSRLPRASGNLQVEGDGKDGAILRLRGMPTLEPGQVYQAWVQRGGTFEAQPTFEVGADGAGAAAVPGDLSDAQAVLVTRERRGGARAPTERPVINVPL
jgi:anti-sigma-K factor RskA